MTKVKLESPENSLILLLVSNQKIHRSYYYLAIKHTQASFGVICWHRYSLLKTENMKSREKTKTGSSISNNCILKFQENSSYSSKHNCYFLSSQILILYDTSDSELLSVSNLASPNKLHVSRIFSKPQASRRAELQTQPCSVDTHLSSLDVKTCTSSGLVQDIQRSMRFQLLMYAPSWGTYLKRRQSWNHLY